MLATREKIPNLKTSCLLYECGEAKERMASTTNGATMKKKVTKERKTRRHQRDRCLLRIKYDSVIGLGLKSILHRKD